MTATTMHHLDGAAAATNQQEQQLLDKLGGPAALKATVYEFYGRILNDERLEPFFRGVDMKALKDHQYKFMEIAFTSIPDDLDVAQLIAEKHARLFETKGLNADHFDMVATHLVETLQHLGVAEPVIQQVVGVVGPLREVFDAEATKVQAKEQVLLDRLGGPSALKNAVYEFYGRLLVDDELEPFFVGQDMKKLREHQYRFMELAFTKIPDDINVPKLMAEKHARLFEKGLNAHHFDLVAGHLVATLQHFGVAQDVIDDVVATIGPLRTVFDR